MQKFIKTSALILWSVLLVLFLIPIVFVGILNAGNATGIVLCIGAIVCTLKSQEIILFFKRLYTHWYGKIIAAVLLLFMGFATVIFAYSSVLIFKSAHNPPRVNTTAIVLGCKVNTNGPSLMLRSRIDAAYYFLSENPNVKCIVSGGKGDDEPISEALCMYNELVKMGIDKNRLYKEENSSNTEENIRYSKAIIQQEQLCPNVTLITNDFHQRRATMHAEKLGIKCSNISGSTPLTMFPTYFLREVGGVILELFPG